MSNRAHWNHVYQSKAPDAVSWYRPHLDTSLALLDDLALPTDAHIADVGGGASTFVDDLLARGFHHISVLDLSEHALKHSQQRLGDRAASVRWIAGDATTTHFEREGVDLWHDRAVFHFLTDPHDRTNYLDALHHSVRPGGYVILATFGPEGPDKCSGLPVQKYSAEALLKQLGPAFEGVGATDDLHTTPWESTQAFTYLVARRRPKDDA